MKKRVVVGAGWREMVALLLAKYPVPPPEYGVVAFRFSEGACAQAVSERTVTAK